RLDDIVTSQAPRRGAAEALREEDRAWTYAELAASTASAARRLADAGARPGDRVLVVSENCAALVALLFAITRVGAWPVLVNARLSAREIDAIRDHCTPRRILYVAHVSAEAAAHAARHGATESFVVDMMGDLLIGPQEPRCEPEPVSADTRSRVAA